MYQSSLCSSNSAVSLYRLCPHRLGTEYSIAAVTDNNIVTRLVKKISSQCIKVVTKAKIKIKDKLTGFLTTFSEESGNEDRQPISQFYISNGYTDHIFEKLEGARDEENCTINKAATHTRKADFVLLLETYIKSERKRLQ